MTTLTRDFVEKRIVMLHTIPGLWMVPDFNAYQLDLRMCFLKNLRYTFAWGDESQPVISAMPIIEQPSRIVKIDISLNDLRVLDAAALHWFKEARSLNASVNRIDSFPVVGMLPRLVQLNLGYNYISSLEHLEHCENLIELQLNHNTLSSLRTLPLLPQLATLNVDGNSLTSLDGVQSLPRLRHLSARRNAITNILAVTTCRILESLDLNANKVADIEIVVATLQQMKQLQELTLKENPVAKHPSYTRTIKAMLKVKVLDGVALHREGARNDEEEEEGGSGSMLYFRRVAREAFMDRIRQSRIGVEENVRHLQERIITMLDGHEDFEDKMMTEMDLTLKNIEDMDLALMDTPRRKHPRMPFYVGDEPNRPAPSRPKRSEHKDPDNVLRLASLQLARDLRQRRDREEPRNLPVERGTW